LYAIKEKAFLLIELDVEAEEAASDKNKTF
jgi:hypothetical protein